MTGGSYKIKEQWSHSTVQQMKAYSKDAGERWNRPCSLEEVLFSGQFANTSSATHVRLFLPCNRKVQSRRERSRAFWVSSLVPLHGGILFKRMKVGIDFGFTNCITQHILSFLEGHLILSIKSGWILKFYAHMLYWTAIVLTKIMIQAMNGHFG